MQTLSKSKLIDMSKKFNIKYSSKNKKELVDNIYKYYMKYKVNELINKCKEFNIKGYSGKTKKQLIDKLLEFNIPNTKKEIKKVSKKKNIPKKLKDDIWNVYIGKNEGIGSCYVCSCDIDSKHFEAGHIVSEYNGGEATLKNLRPICEACNKSVGIKNMDEYKEKHYPIKEKSYHILFQEPTHRIIGRERRSKLIDPESELYKILDKMFLKVIKTHSKYIVPRRMDFHFELVKRDEDWNEKKLVSRCSQLHGKEIQLNWAVKNNALMILGPSIDSYGETHITLVKFKDYVPDTIYNILDFDIKKVKFFKEIHIMINNT